MPSADTFSIPPIAEFIARHMQGRDAIDPFAKSSLLGRWRNDLDPDTAAEWHLEASEFCALMARDGVRAPVGLFDPPYSPRQISECYKHVGRTVGMEATQNAALYKRCRDALVPCLTDEAIVLSFGWNSAGMGSKRGFEQIELMLVAHGGAHNDTICLAERRIKPLEFIS